MSTNPYEPASNLSTPPTSRIALGTYWVVCGILFGAGLIQAGPGVIILADEWPLYHTTSTYPPTNHTYSDFTIFGRPVSMSTFITASVSSGGLLFIAAFAVGYKARRMMRASATSTSIASSNPTEPSLPPGSR